MVVSNSDQSQVFDIIAHDFALSAGVLAAIPPGDFTINNSIGSDLGFGDIVGPLQFTPVVSQNGGLYFASIVVAVS